MLSSQPYLSKPASQKSHSFSSYSKKKVSHFSYSPSDKIGKGFSSVVYKATNELTSTTFQSMIQSCIIIPLYFLF